MAIDIGSGATDRGTTNTGGYTAIDLANPANANGVLTSVEFWFGTDATGVKVGTFYGTAPDFTPRSVATIGNVTSGSKQTFTGLSISVQTGDYLGFFSTTGDIDYELTGGSDVYIKLGDQFGAGLQTYTQNAGDVQSVYATGVDTPGWVTFWS